MLNVFAMLLVASLFFNVVMNYMAVNISDFESVALPPKKQPKNISNNPTLKIDATSRDFWTLVDFTTGATYQVKSPEENVKALQNDNWDLGFHRTKIISNGGVTNPKGRTAIINLGKVAFDQVREAPLTGYLQDSRAWGNLSNKAIASWYNYRTRTHNIESNKHVYIVKTSLGGHMKMRILNYYCKRQENECAQTMCGRAEAACLTIEYVHAYPSSNRFPAPEKPAQPQPISEISH